MNKNYSWAVMPFFLFLLAFSSTKASDKIPNIKVDQFGYRPHAQKVAIVSSPKEGFNGRSGYEAPNKLFVINNETQEVAFSANISPWKNGQVHGQSGDKVWWFDFTALTAPGNYFIIDSANYVRSDVFAISDHVYNHVLKHAVRMFYYQRCGVPKEAPYAEPGWTDEACHIHEGQDKKCRPRNGDGPEYDLSGGWHDAGDYNKYTTFTFRVVHQLLSAYQDKPTVFQDNYNIPESGNGIPDLVDEIKFELDFLQKMMLEDGRTLLKVSVTEHQSASPASADTHARYYAPPASSATRCLASLFAHAYLVFNEFDDMKEYANTLLAKSELAWNWVKNNSEYSTYDNSGFASASPEKSEYEQDTYLFTAAVYLYLATQKEEYKNHIEANYQKIYAMDRGYWYGYEYTHQRSLLDYCNSPNADAAICQEIHQSFNNSMQGNEFMSAVNNQTDAYRAYLKDGDYGWGSNSLKSKVGEMFYDMYQYGIADDEKYLRIAEEYIHYIHGRNALGKVFLTNMNEYGAQNSANEMYHLWFGNDTDFDNAQTSKYGPPPVYLTGGVNKNYKPASAYEGPVLSPPLNQPVQKFYKDWNTSWPENSWEITEPAIYYQAAYIMLLSKFASDQPTEIEFPEIITGKEKEMGSNDKKPYPVPVQEFLTIPKTSAVLNQVELVNMNGQVIPFDKQKVEDKDDAVRLDVRGINSKFFLVRLEYADAVELHKVIRK